MTAKYMFLEDTAFLFRWTYSLIFRDNLYKSVKKNFSHENEEAEGGKNK